MIVDATERKDHNSLRFPSVPPAPSLSPADVFA